MSHFVYIEKKLTLGFGTAAVAFTLYLYPVFGKSHLVVVIGIRRWDHLMLSWLCT